MKKHIRLITKIITSIAVAAVVILAMLLVGVRIFGLQVYTVLSGSMEPKFMTGSVIYVRQVTTASKMKNGDIITFRVAGDTIATHRIIEVVPDESNADMVSYRTQGDNNDSPDGTLVRPTDIVGQPVFTIPRLGYLADYIQRPPGTYVAVAVCAILIMVVFMADYIADELLTDPKKKKSTETEEEKKPLPPRSPAPERISVPQRREPHRPASPPVRSNAETPRIARTPRVQVEREQVGVHGVHRPSVKADVAPPAVSAVNPDTEIRPAENKSVQAERPARKKAVRMPARNIKEMPDGQERRKQ